LSLSIPLYGFCASFIECICFTLLGWSVPLKNWTGNMNFSNAFERLNLTKKNSGRGQADDSLPGSGAGRPRLCLSMKGGFV